MMLVGLVHELLGPDAPVGVQLPDGTIVGPSRAPARLVFRSPDGLRRLLTAPGELGVARAYVAGELDVEGDIHAALALQEHRPPSTSSSARSSVSRRACASSTWGAGGGACSSTRRASTECRPSA